MKGIVECAIGGLHVPGAGEDTWSPVDSPPFVTLNSDAPVNCAQSERLVPGPVWS